MRPVLALYIGGMGSRKQNFYNNLVRRYGFKDAAHQVQDLYLAGKKAQAGEALPDELIDMVCLCGPRDVVRERLAAYRDAGVGSSEGMHRIAGCTHARRELATLMVSPMAFDRQDRIEQLRAVAELAT
jgi:Luciferase-like monooxygenase